MFGFKKKSIIALGTLALCSAGLAHAQPGSRICGIAAYTPAGNFGMLYESRSADVSDGKQCSEFIKKVKQELQTNQKLAKLKELPWKDVSHGTKCEQVGANFVDGVKYKSADMCDNMEAKDQGYMVQTVPTPPKGQKVTTYTKL